LCRRPPTYRWLQWRKSCWNAARLTTPYLTIWEQQQQQHGTLKAVQLQLMLGRCQMSYDIRRVDATGRDYLMISATASRVTVPFSL
jgi:hypothetical protein